MLQGRYVHRGMAYVIKQMTSGPGYLVLGSPKGHLKQLGREYQSLKAADAAARQAMTRWSQKISKKPSRTEGSMRRKWASIS